MSGCWFIFLLLLCKKVERSGGTLERGRGRGDPVLALVISNSGLKKRQ